MRAVGISGFAFYTPRFRVLLERWCEWTGNEWSKTAAVVGQSFRQPGSHENVYTMAANAALRLIEQYSIDPQRIGYLALGTESSTDNAAGAVIVRGMLDRVLAQRGLPRLARDCEVPEFKHACLGGVYAIKNAIRYLQVDGRGRQALVVCADIAEYERGSPGEPTQGAGAVALLLEEDPRICSVLLDQAGSSSEYRACDFRKPVSRHFHEDYAPHTQRFADFPVFNGKYSVACYVDAIGKAAQGMQRRLGADLREFYQDAAAIFMHRPFRLLPCTGLASLYVAALASSDDGRDELTSLAEVAKVRLSDALAELEAEPDLYEHLVRHGVDAEPRPSLGALVRAARSAPAVQALIRDKMRLGADEMAQLGNLYAAALPTWLAAAFEQATLEGVDLSEKSVLAVGYGSGDAAEVVPLRVAPSWREASRQIHLRRALEGPLDLTREQYERRHDGVAVELPPHIPSQEFVVKHIGTRWLGPIQDVGVEQYGFAE